MSGILRTVSLIAAGVLLQSAVPGGQSVGPSATASSPGASALRVALDRYCVACHNERLLTAGLALDSIDVVHVAHRSGVWEKIVRKLRSGSMPPVGRPRPDDATYDSLANWLETQLDRASAVSPDPGRPALHRLNRAEYVNAIRDLLALEIDPESLLPPDESGFGFDNIADVLSLSPALMERYFLAARKISRAAVGDPATESSVATYTVHEALIQDDRISEDLPFGSRGGMVVRHHFPVDGEYVVQVRLRRGGLARNAISGIDNREQVDIRLDGSRLQLFTVGGQQPEQPPGYRQNADDDMNVRVPVTAGTHSIGVAFVKRPGVKTEGLGLSRVPAFSTSFSGASTAMTVEHVEVEGPLSVSGPGDTPSRRRLFVCRPRGSQDEEACAKRIIGTVGRRAFRRPLAGDDVDRLHAAYVLARRDRDFEEGIRFALQRILVSPEFLFRIESDPPDVAAGAGYPVSDLELASRLSFFLWSSIPDDELLDLAARGDLRAPAVLEQQVRRMLADDRAVALVHNFGGQWLRLRNLRMVAPSSRLFPEFDYSLRDAMWRETELFLDSQLREDRSVLDLLRSDYTFLNERLARHYGIPNVYGSHFRRDTLTDERRPGILGHASVLTVTSYSTRTSPVVRGKWLLENILAEPPPPPPDDVPPLEEDEATPLPTSVRGRLEQHRRNPACASCHARIDPLGFALENFDALGKWRATELGLPVDASGVLLDGTRLDGPVDLRDVLLRNEAQFVGAFTEKLLTYALGRGVEYYDMPAVRRIVRGAAPSDYRWSTLILGIVKSTPFQMRRAEP